MKTPSKVLLILLSVHVLGLASFAADKGTEISLDQVGYLPQSSKVALAKNSGNRHSGFVIRRREDRAIVFRGQLGVSRHDADSGDDVRTADFSSFNQSGTYYLEVPGLGRSWNFAINSNIYEHSYYLAMRSYYGQRCGTAVDLGPDFPQYVHGPCHLKGAFHPSSGREGIHSSAKGWHDAGDYGRYVVNSGISTGTLLWTWELYGDRLKRISLKIPESGHEVPDILSEVRWNLDWMLSMQDYDGGVFHKQTSDHFAAFIMPDKDDLVSYVIGTGQQPWKSSCATADTAAVAAIASRVYRKFDPAYSQVTLASAKLAWNWLDAHPAVIFANPPGVSTGAYGDSDCSDERLWAAAELWRTTGEPLYSQYFQAKYKPFMSTIRASSPQTWSNVAPLALWSYALSTNGDPAVVDTIERQSVNAALQIAQRTTENPYHVSLTTADYVWGSNAVAANYAMQLLIANRFHPDAHFVEAANDDVHYIFGTNTFSLSWVTHLGEHSFTHPHHRPSAADDIDSPWPGLMSGGPNAGREDPVMKVLVPQTVPPARAYVDQTGAYACNEVAINWNAPLVFTLAGLLPDLTH